MARRETNEKKDVPQKNVFDYIKYDAANIYFNNLIGSNIGLGTQDVRLPLLMTLKIAPNYTSSSDMLNTAATSVYSFVRHANSGRTNYESSDLMVYNLQMADILAILTHINKVIGLANYYSTRSVNSKMLIDFMGIDSANLRANLADARYRYNNIVYKLKAFAIPKSFTYFYERMAEVALVYADEENVETAQLYTFVPSHLAKFNATAEGGSGLDFIDLGDYQSINSLLNKVEEVIDHIRSIEDVNIMSGDILKAYGEDLVSLEPIDKDHLTIPIFDSMVLYQIQNAHIVDIEDFAQYGSLVQQNNKLTQGIQLTSNGIGSLTNRFINSPTFDVDANIVFALSKYQVSVGESRLLSANITFIHDVHIHTDDPTLGLFGGMKLVQVQSTAYAYDVVSKFKFYPYLYNSTLAKADTKLPIGDMHAVARVSITDTNRLNDARFLLAFQTKQML